MGKISKVLLLLGVCAFAVGAWAQASDYDSFCERHRAFCTETFDGTDYQGNYVGHDEPSLLFYSATKGSGNSNIYFITLPRDPKTLPTQDGTGGTFNFQLHPAFWFGMAMCDSESSPNFTKTCVPDTDDNIFDDPLSTSPQWIGHHPGTAFMEMQFYPPGWVLWPLGSSCDPFMWCAALNIDSLSQSLTQTNNSDCLQVAGEEPVNFAFITKDGVPIGPPDPLQATAATTFTPDPTKVLFMNAGDTLKVVLRDTPAGFRVDIWDLDTGGYGFMTASTANGFAQVLFEPSSSTCHSQPYAFHPMYATSSEHTRVPWAAHSYNIAFSDEIGHFEYCDAVSNGVCTSKGVNDPGGLDSDDFDCFGPASSSRVAIGGCTREDSDFDGPTYGNNWPGTLTNPRLDRTLHARPVRFTSPLFFQREQGNAEDEEKEGNLKNYDRVAFETNLPSIEGALSPPCDRTTGANCINPPTQFYPIYTTVESEKLEECVWQEGGAHIPGTLNDFGGTSTAEYGPLLLLNYASAAAPGFSARYNDFRQVLAHNPCPVKGIDTLLGR